MFKNGIHVCFNSFSLYSKIKMNKTSQKVTKDKDPKLVEEGRNGRENFMKKMKEDILIDAKKGSADAINSSNKTTSPTNN